MLLKPRTYPDADIVMFLVTQGRGARTLRSLSSVPGNNRRIFSGHRWFQPDGRGFDISRDHPEQAHGIHVTEAYFRLFGAPLILGQTFTPQEAPQTAAMKWCPVMDSGKGDRRIRRS